MSEIDFEHRQTAHCESGTMAALLRHGGLELSEPMVFGLSGALTYACIPLLKIGGMPLLAYRMPPGKVIKGLASRLGISMKVERYNKPEIGMRALDNHLNAGRPVGLQASVYWLPYFPKDMRFHFNAHNLVAYGYEGGKEGGKDYLISDPTLLEPVVADAPSLKRARFVKGVLAPKGMLYFPESIPENVDIETSARKAIKTTTRMMLKTPLSFIGIKGIRHVARKLERIGSDSKREEFGKLFIGHMVRMQEEIGTGGAGFRFLYASFLQECGERASNNKLLEASVMFTDAGDEWRRFALMIAKMLKGRAALDFNKLSGQLIRISEMEEQAYRFLQKAI